MKKCKDCNKLKPKTEFYGYQGECKDCTKLRVKKREALKRLDPKWVEKERKRSREKYRRLNYKDKYKSSKQNNRTQYVENYSNKFPEKVKAKNLSQHVQVPKGLEKHHWSYNDKHVKDIIPLSIKDHNQLHRFLDYDSEKMMYRCKVSVNDFKKGDLLNTKKITHRFLC